MRDIICFVGKSSSGKDFLLEHCNKEFGWNKIISHTTRPIREGEQEGLSYHFISDTEFFEIEENHAFIETTSYKSIDGTWHYGFHKDAFEVEGIKTMVINKHGLDQLIEKGYGDRIIVLYIVAPFEVTVKRYHSRMSNPTTEQLAEAYLRILRDIEGFEKFEDEIEWDKTFYNYGTDTYKNIPLECILNDGLNKLCNITTTIKTFVGYVGRGQ